MSAGRSIGSLSGVRDAIELPAYVGRTYIGTNPGSESVSVIASALDAGGTAWVEEARTRLPDGLGSEGDGEPAAHLSYHVADEYASPLVERALPRIARTYAPLTVRPSGLTVFTEPRPIVCASIVRSPDLSRIHRAIWDAAGVHASGTVGRFAPERWAPHVTLVGGGIDRSDLPAVVGSLCEVDFDREFVVDTVVCVLGAGDDERLVRFDLGNA